MLIEHEFCCPIRNPATRGVSQTFVFGGKIDQAYADQGSAEIIVRDWKTCSSAAQTERQKLLSYQADLYAVAIEEKGMVVGAAEFCLIERPTIKLCGKDKTPADYEARCLEWLDQEGKLVKFRIPSTAERRLSARQWLWDISQQILESRRSGRFVCNEQACYTYQRECPYMNLCLAQAQGHDADAIIETDYETTPPHRELEAGRDNVGLLTYSSASLFALCQRKYFWRYVMRIRPRQDEDSEALIAGINVHHGLALALTHSLGAGLAAVSPDVLGIDEKGLQNRSKARAMVRAAFEKWGGK
jgi:hypothetical protein